jgi:hypothetical protein
VLTIRNEQVEALRKMMEQSFVDKTVDRLRAADPQGAAALGEDGVRRFVERHIAEAAGHGIDLSLDVERYVSLMYGIKQCWNEAEDSPWVNSILNDESLPPETLLDRLEGEALLAGVLKEA